MSHSKLTYRVSCRDVKCTNYQWGKADSIINGSKTFGDFMEAVSFAKIVAKSSHAKIEVIEIPWPRGSVLDADCWDITYKSK